MTRWTVVAIALVGVALAGVGVLAVHRAKRDRAELFGRFAAERQRQLDETARRIEEDFADIREDLRFAGELVEAAASGAERRRELGALLAVVKQYRLIGVFDATGERILAVQDPLARPGFQPEPFAGAMSAVAAQAAGGAAGEIVTSAAIPGDPGGWFRVFATALPRVGPGASPGAIAVLVDTAPFFTTLALLATGPATQALVLDVHGQPAPLTARRLAAGLAELDAGRAVPPAFAAMVRDMRAGRAGSVALGDQEARRLGLEPEALVAVFGRIPLRGGGGHWSIGTLSSTGVLRAHERAAMVRLVLTSAAVALCLLGLGVYVVVTSRRAVMLCERLRHASQLAHLHDKTEKILDHIPTGVMALGEGGVITAVNRAFRERIPAAAVGDSLAHAFPRAPAAIVARLRSLVDSARVFERVQSLFGVRLALFGAEGRYNVHAVPLEAGFPDARCLIVVEDLSEVRSLESQLLRAEKLAMVGVIAAGIAHEIGAPLGVVRGRAEHLITRLGAEHPQAGGVRVIIDEIDHVTRTIQQLLALARVDPTTVKPVEVAPVAVRVAELLRVEACRRELRLAVDMAPGLPPVQADPDQLQQVLVNLIMNACDACAPGGHIQIVGTAEPDGSPAWRGVRIEVIDDGCGMAEEQRHQVLDFLTTKRRGQDTGLGLAIAAQIVRNHGAAIELASEPGKGTRVTLHWPAGAPPVVEPHAIQS